VSAASTRALERDAARAGRAILAAFVFTAVFFAGVFPPFSNPNELSRLETVYAAVELGTFRIDGAIPVLGDHEDKSLSGGHAYSNKAPGLALAAIPVYRALRLFRPAPTSASDPIFVWLRILTVSAAGALALARFLRRVLPRPGGALVGFALAFGTPFLFYARSFFAHAWAASLLFLAWDLLETARARAGTRRVGLFVACAGALAGWAAISEYTVLPLAAFLVLAVRPRRGVAAFAGGAAVALAALLAYDAVCFGSPFVLSSAREAHGSYAELARSGLFGVGAPRLAVARDYLFHPARGLLLFSPFWLWLPAGFVRGWRADRRSDLPLAAGVLLFFILLTGYPNWHGGWSLGDRYLLPALFLAGLALPSALETPASRGAFAAAVVFSGAVFVWTTASFPHFPLETPWPPATASLWFLRRGWYAGNVLGGLGFASLLAPILAAAAALLAALRSARPVRPGRLAAAAASLLLFGIGLAAPIRTPYLGKLWRAAVFGAYSGRDPERRELERVVREASTPLERRQAAGAWRLYGVGRISKTFQRASHAPPRRIAELDR